MSILIKGMEMPPNCCQCPVNMEICKRGYKYLLEHPELYDKRANDCPLVPVPEHGRLIDADRLRHSHCAECTLYPDNCLGDECDWDSIFHIDHAPTIIPADPADKEEE